jgi:hypothetical protein
MPDGDSPIGFGRIGLPYHLISELVFLLYGPMKYRIIFVKKVIDIGLGLKSKRPAWPIFARSHGEDERKALANFGGRAEGDPRGQSPSAQNGRQEFNEGLSPTETTRFSRQSTCDCPSRFAFAPPWTCVSTLADTTFGGLLLGGPPCQYGEPEISVLSRVRPLLRAFAAGAALSFASAALAEEACAYRPTAHDGLVDAESVADYRSTLLVCHGADGANRVAIRTMNIDKLELLLLADPDGLSTRIERAAWWTCQPASEESLAGTRYLRTVAKAAETPGVAHRTFLQNAGLIHGAAPGAFVTGDLCPTRQPLDRRFFEKLMTTGQSAPVALSISGLWLLQHAADFHWLMDKQAAGALDIVWTNHSYHHPYAKGRPDDQTFMMTKGLDPDYEILETERLLIANGGVPSVFFRFPGLVSNSPLMDAVRRHHLIVLGTDAWLAKGQRPGAGSIVLVHPNGNEEGGIDRFARYVDQGALARPLEPVLAAPP